MEATLQEGVVPKAENIPMKNIIGRGATVSQERWTRRSIGIEIRIKIVKGIKTRIGIVVERTGRSTIRIKASIKRNRCRMKENPQKILKKKKKFTKSSSQTILATRTTSRTLKTPEKRVERGKETVAKETENKEKPPHFLS